MSASWCMPCKIYARTFEEIKKNEKYKDIVFEEHDVDDDECCTAVLACDVGETPDITQTDGAPGADEQEAEAACESFSYLHLSFLLVGSNVHALYSYLMQSRYYFCGTRALGPASRRNAT